MAGKRSLGELLRDKWRISGSSRASKRPVANATQPQPGLDQAAGTASESGCSTTIDATAPAYHVVSPEETVPTGAAIIAVQDHHELALPIRPLSTSDALDRVLQVKDQVIQKQSDNVQSTINASMKIEIQHVDLWDRAYEMLRARDASLVEKYENILDGELKASLGSKAVLGAVTLVGMSVGLAGQSSA
ncbi:hypothetical protein N431DRAFT_76430 [Stipitochalara longipes BDJ]|nr:hypothetical protein N431DRAFT_76430 [Stipitochalara longipes BDJ]